MSGSSADFGITSRSGKLVFGTGSSVRAAIDSSGNVGIGTASPNYLLTVKGTSSASTPIISVTDAVSNTGKHLKFGLDTSTGSGFGWLQYTHEGTAHEKIKINPSGGSVELCSGTTVASSTGLAVTGTMSATGTISTTGNLAVTTTGSFGSGQVAFGQVRIGFASGQTAGLSNVSNDDSSGALFQTFARANGTTIGSISRVGTTDAVVYNTTSDGRLKENLRDFTDSGRLIDALKPRVFDWKSDTDGNGKDVIGFVAQEEHAADPVFAHIGAISVGDDDPTTITKQWQRSDAALIPILVAELQSLRKRLAALESKI